MSKTTATPAQRGRPLKGTSALDAIFKLRLTQEQHAKLVKLGGTDWLRARIDRAKEVA